MHGQPEQQAALLSVTNADVTQARRYCMSAAAWHQSWPFVCSCWSRSQPLAFPCPATLRPAWARKWAAKWLEKPGQWSARAMIWAFVCPR